MSYAEERRRKRFEAAARVEELAAIAKQMATDLRGEEGESGQVAANDTAYGRVYWLRKQLGYVVNTLGPPGPPDSWVTRVVEREYGSEAGWTTPVNREG